MNACKYLVPLLSRETGNCLTMGAYEAIGIQQIAYRLGDLIIKPGIHTLLQIPNLAAFCGWKGKIILNGTLPEKKKGNYTWHSAYDGQRVHLTEDQVVRLIKKLAADILLLPTPITETCEALLAAPYLFYHRNSTFSEFLNQVKRLEEPTYISGAFHWEEIKALLALNYHFVETEKPALDATVGLLYSKEGLINLNDLSWENAQEILDLNCICRGCQQSFTRAYLHHLLVHCPLLGLRILIEHNYTFLATQSY